MKGGREGKKERGLQIDNLLITVQGKSGMVSATVQRLQGNRLYISPSEETTCVINIPGSLVLKILKNKNFIEKYNIKPNNKV